MPQIVLQYHEFAILIVIALVVYLVGPLVRDMIIQRFRKGEKDYVPTEICEGYRSTCQMNRGAATDEFRKEMRENFAVIKGILIVLATGQKPDIDNLTDLFR